MTGVTAASYDVNAAWATPDDLIGGCCKGGYDDSALMDASLLMASTILYHMSGRRWPGVATDIIRPTAEADSRADGWMPYDSADMPTLNGYGLTWGMWGLCSCNRLDVCGCTALSAVRLPGYPVVSIIEVKIDGAILDPSRYTILDRAYLALTPQPGDARQGWPCCQRLDLDVDQAGTWQVTYRWGSGPPVGGRMSAAMLGCELYKAFKPSAGDECRLPKRVTTITRQGITMAVLDATLDIFRQGGTGIPEVDLWLGSLAAGKRDRGSAVLVPEHLAGHHRDNP